MAAFKPFTLSTDRLTLRFLGVRDIPALFAMYSDPEVVRYWSSPPWTELVQAETSMARTLDGYRNGEALRMGIVLTATGELVGECLIGLVGLVLGRPGDASCGDHRSLLGVLARAKTQ